MITARIVVTGSRDWTDKSLIRLELAQWHTRCLQNPTLIHGGCPTGADAIADDIARGFGWSVEVYPAQWSKFGRAAGPIRNGEMLDSGVAHVVAFRLNRSAGTEHAVKAAKERGIPVTSWIVDDSDYPNALREEWKRRVAA